MYVCSNYLVAPPYDHIEGPGGRVREHDDVDHGGEVELLAGPGLTVVVFPPFSIPAGSGKIYLNSRRGNAGKMREIFVP